MFGGPRPEPCKLYTRDPKVLLLTSRKFKLNKYPGEKSPFPRPWKGISENGSDRCELKDRIKKNELCTPFPLASLAKFWRKTSSGGEGAEFSGFSGNLVRSIFGFDGAGCAHRCASHPTPRYLRPPWIDPSDQADVFSYPRTG
jgi:hypothetical protein